MSTLFQRFVNARMSIQLINQYIKDGGITAEVGTSDVEKGYHLWLLIMNIKTFVSCTPGSTQYRDRAAILKEFEAFAENLNVTKTDPICQTHPSNPH